MGHSGLNHLRRGKPMPRNAAPILEARLGGLKPAGTVIVSFVGDTPWDGPTVYCDSGQKYDWAWAEKLEFCVVVNPETDATDALENLFKHQSSASYLCLIDIQLQQVSYLLSLQPQKLWHRKVVSDFFPE